MTKFCRACFTVNRDRAMYCRGCAGRFKDAFPPADASAPPARERQAAPGSASAAKASPSPALGAARPSALRSATSRANAACSMLMPMGAAALAALVVWHQWSNAGELPPRAVGEVGQTQSKHLPPGSDQAGAASPSDTTHAPQETLLALTLEHDARQQRESTDTLAGDLRILNVEPLLLQADPPSEQTPSTTTAKTVVASARPAHRQAPRAIERRTAPGQETWTTYAFTGPCDRYNPFGEALCKNAPASARSGGAAD